MGLYGDVTKTTYALENRPCS